MKSRQGRREDDDRGAGGNRKERHANHLIKEVEEGKGGRGMCCKVWTALRHDSLGVIMIEWSLIDCLSPQNLQSISVLWMRPLWQCLDPVDLSWAPIPSSMIHVHSSDPGRPAAQTIR